MSEKITKTDEEWKEELNSDEYEVCRQKGTERAFTGMYWDCKDKGVYKCRCCGVELFSSETKFDSGTGWPSFFKPEDDEQIEYIEDRPFNDKRYFITNKKLKQLGWKQTINFEDGINELINYFSS